MSVLVVAPSEQPPSSAAAQRPAPPRPPLSSSSVGNGALPVVRGHIPVVQLQSESISDSVAASVASSLLGHVLFLKNQIPMPIAQLARMSGTKSTNSRTAKLRSELLDSYDTLASHLDTTFTALSTAFARASTGGAGTSKAYLAIMIGPSVGTAKSKVLLAVDGLETKIWGQRDDRPNEDSDDEDQDEEDQDEEDDDDDDDEGEEHNSDVGHDDDEQEPPDSDDEDEAEDEESEEESTPPNIHQVSHAAEQLALRTADRLLSRALVSADCDGNGLAAELNPTQTHILIRAPRRFKHPAWVPRQNVTASLEGTLQQFLGASSDKDKKKGKVEGVWVGCLQPGEDHDQQDLKEDDELIWWSWDGKLVGFAGW